MLAYVKYDDNFKCILPVHLVKGFAPKGEEDFDPSKKIQAFWISEDRKVEGFYPGFVHALAGKQTQHTLYCPQKKVLVGISYDRKQINMH